MIWHKTSNLKGNTGSIHRIGGFLSRPPTTPRLPAFLAVFFELAQCPPLLREAFHLLGVFQNQNPMCDWLVGATFEPNCAFVAMSNVRRYDTAGHPHRSGKCQSLNFMRTMCYTVRVWCKGDVRLILWFRFEFLFCLKYFMKSAISRWLGILVNWFTGKSPE